jgi:hypothetical protein
MKPMELVGNAPKLPGDLYFHSMWPRPFWGLLPQDQACGETGRERQAVASIACEDRGLTSQFSPIATILPKAAWSSQDPGLRVNARMGGKGSNLFLA